MKTYPLAICLLLAVPVFAQQPSEISVFAGFSTGGDFEEETNNTQLDLDDSSLVAVAVHVASRRGGQYEFSYWREDVALDSGGLFTLSDQFDTTAEYFQFGGTLEFSQAQRFRPYVALTIGISRVNPKDNGFNTETFFALTGGGGVRMDLAERLALKLEARALISLLDSGSTFFCANSVAGEVCAIQSSGDAVVRWVGGVGLAYQF